MNTEPRFALPLFNDLLSIREHAIKTAKDRGLTAVDKQKCLTYFTPATIKSPEMKFTGCRIDQPYNNPIKDVAYYVKSSEFKNQSRDIIHFMVDLGHKLKTDNELLSHNASMQRVFHLHISVSRPSGNLHHYYNNTGVDWDMHITLYSAPKNRWWQNEITFTSLCRRFYKVSGDKDKISIKDVTDYLHGCRDEFSSYINPTIDLFKHYLKNHYNLEGMNKIYQRGKSTTMSPSRSRSRMSPVRSGSRTAASHASLSARPQSSQPEKPILSKRSRANSSSNSRVLENAPRSSKRILPETYKWQQPVQRQPQTASASASQTRSATASQTALRVRKSRWGPVPQTAARV